MSDIDTIKPNRIIVDTNTKSDKQIEIDEIKNFLKYQRTMDPNAYMRMIQRKIPSIETSMKQTHDYLNRIHEKKIMEEETNKEKNIEEEKFFFLNNVLERRIAEQLMEVRKQKNLIYENRSRRNQQYAEKRERDYELALKREEELGKKAREEYEKEALLLKQQYNEIIMNKEEEKKHATHEMINELVWQLVDFAFKICEYKTLNDGQITKKQMNEWKILFIKGLPLEDKYFLELNQDKIDLFHNEFPEEKKDNLEINPEILSKVQNINIEGFDLNKSSSQAKLEKMEEKVSSQQKISPEKPNKEEKGDVKDGSHNEATVPENENKTNVDEIHLVINCGNEKKFPEVINEYHEITSPTKEGESSLTINESCNPLIGSIESNVIDFPNSLICRIADNENSNLIHVDEANHNVLRGIQILDEKEFKNYLKGQNDWEYSFCPNPPDVPKRMYDALNEIIDSLNEITRVPENPYELAVLPALPICMSIIGKRFSGKMTLAKKIASIFNLAVLSLEDMIKNAISVSTIENRAGNEDRNNLNRTFKSKKGALTRSQIGSEIQIKMLEGGYPNDELLVQLVIDAISRVDIDHPDCKGGWILVNFPQNREQAVLLEKELTGYEEPKKVKQTLPKRKSNGNIKNNKDGGDGCGCVNKKSTNNTKTETNATTTDKNQDQKEDKLKSGLDLILLMNVDNDIAFKRMTGRKIDTLTGKIYHLEYNPPPENEPGIFERLVPFIDEVDNSNIQNQIAAFDAQVDSIKDFYERFENFNVNFKKFLERPDDKQSIVTAFQDEYNQIEDDLRSDADAKAELHQRTDDLRDKLWEVCDKRKEEAEQERSAIIDDHWIEDHLSLIINIYITMMQVESDHTIGINQLVHDYYIDSLGYIINDDLLKRIGMEYLPDDYMNTEVNQIKQITDILDPFDTGYINWRKFIMNQARILPVPTVEYLVSLKRAYKNLPSYQNGKISKSDYMSVKLWYESMDEDISSETLTIYKRYKNLKEAMFYFFMIENTQVNEDLQFLEECQKENAAEETKESEEKITGEGEGKNDSIITTSNNDKTTSNNATSTDNTEGNASAKTELVAESGDPVEVVQSRSTDFLDNNNNNTNGTDNSGTEENIEEKPFEKEVFDVTSFLMCCCCDINQKVGIEKAFNVVSDDSRVNAEELYNVIKEKKRYNYNIFIYIYIVYNIIIIKLIYY
ncbi:hypothetical protein PIROE2DRAFT_58969 [Piromyces sp. E2]|nr:hypothetical protein PIROE2DRAFT_58969 [Piromyces sp. E2]|eukprot:OUM67060.1 hypothetical protein PIROE2DRAFT_58969 [Piromyces sp. E2]